MLLQLNRCKRAHLYHNYYYNVQWSTVGLSTQSARCSQFESEMFSSEAAPWSPPGWMRSWSKLVNTEERVLPEQEWGYNTARGSEESCGSGARPGVRRWSKLEIFSDSKKSEEIRTERAAWLGLARALHHRPPVSAETRSVWVGVGRAEGWVGQEGAHSTRTHHHRLNNVQEFKSRVVSNNIPPTNSRIQYEGRFFPDAQMNKRKQERTTVHKPQSAVVHTHNT